jgi:membrane-associated protein
MSEIIHFLRHLDEAINNLAGQYGTLTYVILFAIIFAETGLVIIPFLPGDSLLFALGAFAATPNAVLKVGLLYPLLITAALLGDNLNYWIGRKLGRKLFASETSKIFNKTHLIRTEAFFAKYGAKAIIMARFVPIVRTFAPFVAGMGAMEYGRFLIFSVFGAFLWVGLCVTAGYIFGNIPSVKANFEKVIIGIILVSVVPMVIEFLNHKRQEKRHAAHAGTVKPEVETGV